MTDRGAPRPGRTLAGTTRPRTPDRTRAWTATALGVVATAASLVLVPTMSWAAEPPAVPGRLAGIGPDDGDGVKVLLRYVDPDRFYAVHVNRRDGGMRIQRKAGADYFALEAAQPPGFAPPYGQEQDVEVAIADHGDGSVEIRLTIDGRLVHRAVDAGQTGAGAPLVQPGSAGIRADNTEFLLGRLDVHRATPEGERTGAPLIASRFTQPDGLITNQRIQSTQHPDWRVYSGSLFANGSRAWSGVPDDVRPDPESRWSTNSATFRMITHRDDLSDVVVSFGLRNRGYVTPAVVPEIAPPVPIPYPTGTGPVAVERLDGSNHVRAAINVSARAFRGGAAEVVLVSTELEPAAVAGPALAGALRGPLLLSPRSELHPETAAELRRLGARRVHLVGSFTDRVTTQLRAAGLQVTRYAGSSPEQVTGAVARRVGGRSLYLGTIGTWEDGVAVSGGAARTRTPVVLTPANRLGATATAVIDELATDHITVIGNELAPSVVAQLRADGITVEHAGHRRYAIARSSADAQRAAGASPRALWLTAGQRALHSLAAGPAAARTGGVLLVVAGNDLGNTSLEDLSYEGYESRHWARRHRGLIERVLAVGPTDAVSPRVVDQVRAEVVTIVAGMRDIAGTTHQDAIVALLERDIADGYGDGTYRPDRPVSRGQMATFLTNAFALPAAAPTATDAAASVHAAGIGAVTAASIASGYPDGTYRPAQPVTRGQMATFLTNALDLEPRPSRFDDTAGSPHQGAIGAVEHAGIAGGYGDGTYRPGTPVTRGQMATFLSNALTKLD